MTKTWNNDKLNRKSDAEFLTVYLKNRFILKREKPEYSSFVLNLNAEWGFGKTYFLTNWSEELTENNSLVVYFNAWESDFSGDPLVSFISEVEAQLSPFFEKAPKAKKYLHDTIESAKKLFKPSLPIILSILSKKLTGFSLQQLNQIMSDEEDIDLEESAKSDDQEAAKEIISTLVSKSAEKALEEHQSSKKNIKTFKKSLRSFLNYVEKNLNSVKLPLFIFIDELDRCRPTYAIELLENIKHLFGVDGVYFVIATDSRQLAHSIKAVYGNGFDSAKYLKRFFDQEYSFLKPDNKSFSSYLFLVNDLTNEPRFFMPIDNSKGNAGEVFFEKCSSFFNLSLRDQEQICLMLNSIRYAYLNDTLHLGYILFLSILRHLFPEKFERFLFSGNSADREKIIKPIFGESIIDQTVFIKTAIWDGSSGKPHSCSLDAVFFHYNTISDMTLEDLAYRKESITFFDEIRRKIVNDQAKFKESSLGHDLNLYPRMVQQIGQLS